MSSLGHHNLLLLCHHRRLLLRPSSAISLPFLTTSTKKKKEQSCSSRFLRTCMELHHANSSSPVMEFPHLPSAHRTLMVDLISTVESKLGSSLLPSTVPPDVLSFRSLSGASDGALDIKSGASDSSVDFILESWLHCKLPTGAALNITTLFAFLNAHTDAPHLLMEFIQSSASSLIVFIDLLPRRDLVLHPDYLNEFYQETELDKQRQELEKISQVLPYRSSSLYIRSVLSPTAIAVSINCGNEGGESAMEEITGGQLSCSAKEIIRVWLDNCASSNKQFGVDEKAELLRRDGLLKTKTVEIDLAANLPRLFGSEVASRVMGEIQKAFRV